MKLIIDSAAGFALEDTDTGVTFQFAGKLGALKALVEGGGGGPQDFIELVDAVTGDITRFSVGGGQLLFTNTTIESTVEVDLGGVGIDPGLSFQVDNSALGYVTEVGVYGYNDGGVVSTDYIDSPNQWFEVMNMKGAGYFSRQMFSLVSQEMINGNTTTGLWAGGSAGGSCFSPVMYNSGGAYMWTFGHNNGDTPGGTGAVAVNLPLNSTIVKALWNAGYSRFRVGIDVDGQYKLQAYVSQDAIDDSTVTGIDVGYHTIARSYGTHPAAEKIRFRWAGFGANEVLNELPHVVGVPSIDQRFSATGFAYYIVDGIAASDKTQAMEVLAEDGTHVIVKYHNPFDFDGAEVSADELTHTQAGLVAKSPKFVSYPVSTGEEIAALMTATRSFLDLRKSVCTAVKERVHAYYLNADLSDADNVTVRDAFSTANVYANAGELGGLNVAVLAMTATALIPQILLDEIVGEIETGLRMFYR